MAWARRLAAVLGRPTVKGRIIEIPVEVGTSPSLGIRGLLAARDIAPGEVIERCPVALIPVAQKRALEATELDNYYFRWTSSHLAVVLGYGSLMNHDYSANTSYTRDLADNTITFRCAKAVRRGEELTINYNGDPNDKRPIRVGYGVPGSPGDAREE